MSIKKRMTLNTAEELAEAYVFPVQMTAAQHEEAAQQLAQHRTHRRTALTPANQLRAHLELLRYRLEDYVSGEGYNPDLTFGYFLEQYLELIGRKKKEFAADIDIHETQLSQMLKNRREPNESVMIRLELHSGNLIPAIYWLRLVAKEREYKFRTNQEIRSREKQHVTHQLQISSR